VCVYNTVSRLTLNAVFYESRHDVDDVVMAKAGSDDDNDRVLTLFKKIILLIFYRFKTERHSGVFITQNIKKKVFRECVFLFFSYILLHYNKVSSKCVENLYRSLICGYFDYISCVRWERISELFYIIL